MTRLCKTVMALLSGVVWCGLVCAAVEDSDPRLVRKVQYSVLDKRTLNEIRALHGVPDEERAMTVEEVVEALAEGRTWAAFALEVRTETMSVEEMKELAGLMLGKAGGIADPLHARRFASGAARALPGPLMWPVVEAALFQENQPLYFTMSMLVGIMGRQVHPLPEAAARLRELYWIARDDPAIREAELDYGTLRIHHHLIEAMGHCGEAGIDPILETGIRGRSSALALGRIGTERALGILIDWFGDDTAGPTKRDCLDGLAMGGLMNRPEHVREFVREHLTSYLSDPDLPGRRRAAEIASSTGDLYFVPHLVRLRDTDEDEFVREMAARGVETLWRVYDKASEVALAKARYALERRTKQIPYYENLLADPQSTEAHKASFAEKLEEAKAEQVRLQEEVNYLEAEKARFLRGELVSP